VGKDTYVIRSPLLDNLLATGILATLCVQNAGRDKVRQTYPSKIIITLILKKSNKNKIPVFTGMTQKYRAKHCVAFPLLAFNF